MTARRKARGFRAICTVNKERGELIRTKANTLAGFRISAFAVFRKHYYQPIKAKFTMNFLEAGVYCGTVKKYAEGNMNGKWMKLSDYKNAEEFLDACRELHADEKHPELFFEDWQNIPAPFISETRIAPCFWDVMNELDESEHEAFAEWAEYTLIEDDTYGEKDLVELFRDSYVGEYSTEEEFSEEIVDETMNIPENLKMYFDYSALARDLFINDYMFADGYVFAR